jgi:hypothetical protein
LFCEFTSLETECHRDTRDTESFFHNAETLLSGTGL